MPTESRFPSARNPYSHPNGMSIHIDRNTQHLDGILNYCRIKVRFGVVEALNGNIRMLINRK